jgi:hypothetical protein
MKWFSLCAVSITARIAFTEAILHCVLDTFCILADGMPDRKEKHKVVEQKRREKVEYFQIQECYLHSVFYWA